VLPLTPQTEFERELNVTGFPDAPPVAATVYEPPVSAGFGGADVKVIVCVGAATTAIVSVTCGAAEYPPPPA